MHNKLSFIIHLSTPNNTKMATTTKPEENPIQQMCRTPSSPQISIHKSPQSLMQMILVELKIQARISLPLVAMNLTWFAKLAITTAFLGRLGELELAGGTVGLMFANVTGFSVLNGICSAMEPICGQAHGAKNFKLLHKTLIMTITLLLITTLPISFLWLNVDKILLFLGQQKDISIVAKKYLLFLLPDLIITSFLCPFKAYLSSQNITIPTMLSSILAVVLHFPINTFLSNSKGFEGISMGVWITDFVLVFLLAIYILKVETSKNGRLKEGGWWDQETGDWQRLLKLSGPFCLTTCLEWWCIEILVLLTGWLANAKQAVSVLAIVLNFDYLIYSVMVSLATCASVRVSNELGANRPGPAYRSAYVSLSVSVLTGFLSGLVMVVVRGEWGNLFSHNKEIIKGVKKMLLLMAVIELVNFPVLVCGGIVRGTAKPWLAMYANLAGFYLISLPLSVVLGFTVHHGLEGLLMGFLVGVISCLALLLVFVGKINWVEEARKAQVLVAENCNFDEDEDKDEFNSAKFDQNTQVNI